MTEKITIKTDDGELIHCNHYNYGHDKVVVIAHGFYGHKESEQLISLAECLGHIYDVFTFDFRGHGKSSGSFTWAAKEKKDLTAALDYVKERYQVIGLIAFSLGAFISFGVLAEEKGIVQSFVAVSPVSAFKRIDFHFWKLDWKNDLISVFRDTLRRGKRVRIGPFWLAKIDPISIVSTLTVPVLYIHGQRDWVVRHWHSEDLYDKTLSKKKLVLITDGPHAEYLINRHPGKIEDIIKDWFEETLM